MDAVETAAPPNGPPARWRGWVWRVVRVILLVYLGVCLVFSMLQTSLIFPGAASQGRPDAVVRSGKGRELLELKTPGGERVAAVFGAALTERAQPHPDARSRPTLLFFYGNGMCMAGAMPLFDDLRRLGFNVIVSDYLGYGMSGGQPGEAGVYATAEAVWEHAVARPDIDKAKIVPVGWSLGAAASIELASKKPAAGLVILSPFTSMADMARAVLPLFPSSMLLRHHFENERKLADVKVPILVIHGRRDSIIPFSMGQRLATLAGDRATFHPIDDADHNDLFDVGGAEMYETIRRFLDAL